MLGILATRGRIRNVEDYISARNTARGGITTATLIASGMGAWILFAPAEAGAAFGGLPAIIGYSIGSAVPLLALAVLGPRIRRLIPEGHTLTEYALARYGPAFYTFVLIVSIGYMFVFLSAEMTGITGALTLIADIDPRLTAALVGGFVLLYTTYGGIRASIFTDTVQLLVILPLLAATFIGVLFALGGTSTLHASIIEADASLLDPGFLPGIQFGIFVVIAILGAEMLNQAWWQRIYLAKSDAVLKRSFLLAAVAVLPMIFLAGIFGLAAQGLGLVAADGSNASISFFLVVLNAMPTWIVLGVVLLALLLVMSTMDTLLNAIASLVTADVPRLAAGVPTNRLTAFARGLTVLVSVGAVYIAFQQKLSVLTLFLVADLMAAATFVPLLAGLYLRRLGGAGALIAALGGLAAGLIWDPTLRSVVIHIPGIEALLPEARFLYGFVAAFGVSAILTTIAAFFTPRPYDLDELARRVHRLDEPSTPAGPPTRLNPRPQEGDA